jgi:hypothetical protein
MEITREHFTELKGGRAATVRRRMVAAFKEELDKIDDRVFEDGDWEFSMKMRAE